MSAECPADAIEEARLGRGRQPGFSHDEGVLHARNYSAPSHDRQAAPISTEGDTVAPILPARSAERQRPGGAGRGQRERARSSPPPSIPCAAARRGRDCPRPWMVVASWTPLTVCPFAHDGGRWFGCHFPKAFPQRFSKPFLHPEGRRPFSAYGMVSAPRKSFLGCQQVRGDAGASARAVEPRRATFSSRAISRYPP